MITYEADGAHVRVKVVKALLAIQGAKPIGSAQMIGVCDEGYLSATNGCVMVRFRRVTVLASCPRPIERRTWSRDYVERTIRGRKAKDWVVLEWEWSSRNAEDLFPEASRAVPANRMSCAQEVSFDIRLMNLLEGVSQACRGDTSKSRGLVAGRIVTFTDARAPMKWAFDGPTDGETAEYTIMPRIDDEYRPHVEISREARVWGLAVAKDDDDATVKRFAGLEID